MELLPLGPVMMIDTPGIDDEGELGILRIQKAYQVLNKTDLALLVIDAVAGLAAEDNRLIERINAKNIPLLIVANKCEKINIAQKNSLQKLVHDNQLLFVSATQKINIFELKEAIAKAIPPAENKACIVADLLLPNDFVILVVPIDSSAPKGRLILPQQQTIREILEAEATAIIVKENGLQHTLHKLGHVTKFVITDSQVFKKVAAVTPENIPLTSFSILFARYKGNLKTAVQGVTVLDKLADGDRILIGEGCTHHRQCDDIGTVKLPHWIREYTGKELEFIFTSGTEFPIDLSPYRMIIHCGGCMLNEREIQYRYKCAVEQNIPITNYGITIAYINGILKRTLEPFPEIYQLLTK